ncbi:MAG TPA: penicillin-binding protein 2 [Candidatus Saccharimonadales bacterium]|nr:penicillin-binding protein 2 [Candidatus Saccharimonadales bacterium]
MGPAAEPNIHVVRRTRLVYVLLVLIFGVFVLRAFYLQVVKYEYYHKAALSDQLKEYEIPAERGTIKAHMGDSTVSIVLNEKLYTIYADPSLVKSNQADKVANTLADVLGGSASDYKNKITQKDTRYIVLAKKISKDARAKLLGYKYPGIGSEEQSYRTYPDGSLASQLLGFVNNEGQGVYGVEQDLNSKLAGTNGQLKAVTDINGVPLAANTGNILKEPVAGNDLTLTIDVGMQKQLEDIIKKGYDNSKAQGVSAVILDANSGAVKAMGNYPTYNPADYGNVEDSSVFNNAAVSHPIEVGSVMKSLTTAAALDSGSVKANQTYYDPASWTVDDFKITNIEEDGGAGTKGLKEILNLSLNTGATWELMQMGGGQLNLKGRETWYNYMTQHYMLGKATGIEQGYESEGYVPKPEDNGAGINLTYANTSFGQAMTATTIQMAGAMASVVNGGTYYKPYLVDSTTDANNKTTITKPTVVKSGVVSQATTDTIVPLMEYVVQQHHFSRSFDESTYAVGGKTGTAQIAKPTGGYYDDEFNGTYLGFVGGDKVQYVIAVFTYRPKVAGYAGTAAAQPIFGDLAHMLIDNFAVTPKSK